LPEAAKVKVICRAIGEVVLETGAVEEKEREIDAAEAKEGVGKGEEEEEEEDDFFKIFSRISSAIQ
jgi:hypothetical protein